MNIDKGIEDSKAWKTQQAKDTDTPAVSVCRACGQKIYYWHCTEAGCPWCRPCGLILKEKMKGS